MSTQVDFIVSIAGAAKVASSETGLSFELMLSQAALETGWGANTLPGTNNIFNIKADSSWTGDSKTFHVRETWVWVDASFDPIDPVVISLRLAA